MMKASWSHIILMDSYVRKDTFLIVIISFNSFGMMRKLLSFTLSMMCNHVQNEIFINETTLKHITFNVYFVARCFLCFFALERYSSFKRLNKHTHYWFGESRFLWSFLKYFLSSFFHIRPEIVALTKVIMEMISYFVNNFRHVRFEKKLSRNLSMEDT